MAIGLLTFGVVCGVGLTIGGAVCALVGETGASAGMTIAVKKQKESKKKSIENKLLFVYFLLISNMTILCLK